MRSGNVGGTRPLTKWHVEGKVRKARVCQLQETHSCDLLLASGHLWNTAGVLTCTQPQCGMAAMTAEPFCCSTRSCTSKRAFQRDSTYVRGNLTWMIQELIPPFPALCPSGCTSFGSASTRPLAPGRSRAEAAGEAGQLLSQTNRPDQATAAATATSEQPHLQPLYS